MTCIKRVCAQSAMFSTLRISSCFCKTQLRFHEGKSRKHKMTRRRRRREQCPDDRGASVLHLFMFVFMIRHGNRRRTRRRLRRAYFQRIVFTMLKFGENKSVPGKKWLASVYCHLREGSIATMSGNRRWDRQWRGWWKLQVEIRLNYANNLEIIEHAGASFAGEIRFAILWAFKRTETIVTARLKGGYRSRYQACLPVKFPATNRGNESVATICTASLSLFLSLWKSNELALETRNYQDDACYRVYKAISKSASWKSHSSSLPVECHVYRICFLGNPTSMYIKLRFDDKTYAEYILWQRKGCT